MNINNLLSTLDAFLKCPATVGFETPFINLLKESFEKLSCDCFIVKGGLWVYPRNHNQYDVVFLSHIDRHGFLSVEAGTLDYAALPLRLKDLSKKKYTIPLLEQPARDFIDEEVYIYDPKTGKSLFETTTVDASFSEVHQYVRFTTAKEVPTELKGFPGALKRKPGKTSGLVIGQLDNVISAAVLHSLIDSEGGPAIFFSTEEEVGNSAKAISIELTQTGLLHKKMLCLDTTPMNQFKGSVLNDVILRNRDCHASFSASLNQRITKALEEEDLPFSFKDILIEEAAVEGKPLKYGSTELGKLITFIPELEGASIQIPGINYHTNIETVTEVALVNYIKAINSMITINERRLTGDVD